MAFANVYANAWTPVSGPNENFDVPGNTLGPCDGIYANGSPGVLGFWTFPGPFDGGCASGLFATLGTVNFGWTGAGSTPADPFLDEMGASSNLGPFGDLGTYSSSIGTPGGVLLNDCSAHPNFLAWVSGDQIQTHQMGLSMNLGNGSPGFPVQAGPVDCAFISIFYTCTVPPPGPPGGAFKSHAPGNPLGPGQAFVETVSFSNFGAGPGTFNVVDSQPPGITFVSWTRSGGTGGTPAGAGNINDTFTVAGFETITYTINCTAHSTNTTETNFMSVVCIDNGTNTSASDGIQVILPPGGEPSAVTKTRAPAGDLSPGQAFTVTLSFTNPGSGNGVYNITDVQPPGVTFSSWTRAGGSGGTAAGVGNVSDMGMTLGSGATATYTINCIAMASVGSVLNTFNVILTTGNPAGVNATNTITVTAPGEPSAVTKTRVPAGNLTPGQAFVTTLSFTNAGTATGTYNITDAVPPGVTFVSWTRAGGAGGTAAGAGAISDLGMTLAAGATATYTINCLAQGTAGSVTNTFNVDLTSSPAGPVSATNTITVVTPSEPQAVSKTRVPATVLAPGQAFVATLSFTNTGTGSGVYNVVDPVPPGVTFVSWSRTGGTGGTPAGVGAVSDFGVTVASGATVTYTVNCLAQATTSILTNTVTVTLTTGNPAGVPASNGIQVNAPAEPSAVTKTRIPAGPLAPGQAFTVTLSFTNAGSGTGTYAVTDIAPPGVTFVSWTRTGGTGGTPAGVGNVSDPNVGVGPGQTVTYTVNCLAQATTSSLLNTFNARLLTGNPLGVNATNNIDVNAPSEPALVSKTHLPGGSLVPNQPIVFTLSFTNTGAGSGVYNVTDTQPLGIVFTSWVRVGGSGGTPAGAGNLSDLGVTVASGQTVTYTINAIAQLLPGNVINSLNVRLTTGAPAGVTVQDTVSVLAIPTATNGQCAPGAPSTMVQGCC